MPVQWYYADANGQQAGPVSAEEMREAVRLGAAHAGSLAWREDLSDWKPLSEFAGELALDFGVAPTTVLPVPAPTTASANPYSAPEAPELIVRGDASDVVYAGFWSRFAARVIDHFVVAVPVGFFGAFLLGSVASMYQGGPTPDDGAVIGAVVVFYALPLLANFVYFSAMHSSSLQATLGKLALGIKVTDAQGDRLGFGQAAARWFAALLSWLTFCVGFILAGFTERKRALHDMLANTQVVDKWAYTETPERQRRGMSGCLIVFLVVIVFGTVALVGSLAAVSVSQYEQYLERARRGD